MLVKHQMHILIVVLVALLSYGIVAFVDFSPDNNKENITSGQSLAPIHFLDKSSRQVSLDDFKGDVVLVNLWATWCPPCVAELPSLDRLQARLKDKGFKVVAISLDRTSLEAADFLDKAGADHLDLYWDKDKQVPLKWKYAGIPASFLLNRNGNVIDRFDGPQVWDKGEIFNQISSVLQ